MSSDISFHRHSSQAMVSYDGNGDILFYSDPYPFNDVAAQGNSDISLDPFSSSFFSFSPECNHRGFHQANPVQPLTHNGSNINSEFEDFSALDGSGVKTEEECQMGMDYIYNQHFLPHSCSTGAETESASSKLLLQRSYSCNSFHPIQARHNTPMDSTNFQWHALTSPENSFFTGEMKRACSAGDLQNMQATHTSQTESPLLEEVNFKVGRYSAEERKEKISKYRAKRSQRKFNKIIKYACRKTLADNRTRIRGRFARNDETREIPKAPCSSTEEYEDEFWAEFMEGLTEELHN